MERKVCAGVGGHVEFHGFGDFSMVTQQSTYMLCALVSYLKQKCLCSSVKTMLGTKISALTLV